jgi:hypothetical protein
MSVISLTTGTNNNISIGYNSLVNVNVKDDLDNYCYLESDNFCNIEDWRDKQINKIIK